MSDTGLPNDLWLVVFSYLSVPDLSAVALVCSAWRELAEHNYLWRPVYSAEFGVSAGADVKKVFDTDTTEHGVVRRLYGHRRHFALERVAPQHPYDAMFRVVLFGASGVGKSTLMGRFVDNPQQELGVGRIECKVTWVKHAGRLFKLQVWDSKGSDAYRRPPRAVLRDTRFGCALCYDVSDPASLLGTDQSGFRIRDWFEQMKPVLDAQHIPVVIVGCKADLRPHRLGVDEAKRIVRTFTDKEPLVIEVSSVDDINVAAPFKEIVAQLAR